LESVDALKKFLYHQWPDEASMQAAVKLLLSRIGRLAPEEVGDEVASEAGGAESPSAVPEVVVAPPPPAVSEPEPAIADADKKPEAPEEEIVAARRGEPAALPQSKSVRIALERLDQMMNAVGELVINRTRMLGRLAELEKLADVLNFSKARMSDKVAEFQEKYEFSRLTSSQPQMPQYPAQSFMGGGGEYPFRGGYSSYSGGYDPALAEFSELEMDRYDDFSILSRSLTEISA